MYLNKTNRWNWGLVGGQVPYLSGGVRAGTDLVNGFPAYIEQTILLRQTELSGAGVVAYPFNRARRVEFQGGMTQISFDQIIETEAYDCGSGNCSSGTHRDTPLPTRCIWERPRLRSSTTPRFSARPAPLEESVTGSKWRPR